MCALIRNWGDCKLFGENPLLRYVTKFVKFFRGISINRLGL
jgi:hypothetical protein